jgi:hypothetical protein
MGVRMKLLVPAALSAVLLLAGPAQAAPVASDSFSRPDGPIGTAPTGQTWVQANGTWAVRSGRAKVTAAGHISEAVVNTGLATNYKVSADITLSPTPLRANAGLTANWLNHSNNLFCKVEVTAQHKGGFLAIGDIINGTGNSLLAYKTKVGVQNGGTYHMDFSRSGSTMTCTVSGGGLASSSTVKYRLTKTQARVLKRGKSDGLRARWESDEDDGGSAWDNFSVSSI